MKTLRIVARVVVPVLILTTALAGIQVDAAPDSAVWEFHDDFESYLEGENPYGLYDYYTWLHPYDPGPVLPDLYRVATIDSNQVLQFYYDGPAVHFNTIVKLHKQKFTHLAEAGATFYRTEHSMGWNFILFEYQDDDHYYMAGYIYTNKLNINSYPGGVELGSIDLWGDINIMDVNNRIDVARIGDTLVATITRLDTNESKTLEVTATEYTGGRVGFWTREDWPGGVYLNVDDFYAIGEVPDISGCIELKNLAVADAWVMFSQQGEPRQWTRTGSDGCYGFANAISGKRGRVQVFYPEVP